jgi:hypothetical protein
MRLADVSTPYESKAKKQERAAEAARNRRLTWYGGGGVLALLAIVAGLYFTVFSGKGATDALPQEQKDVDNLKYLDQRLNDLNSLIADPALSAAEKAQHQKEKKAIEKDRDDLLKKRPDLKK